MTLKNIINKFIRDFKDEYSYHNQPKLIPIDGYNLIGNSEYGYIGLNHNDCRLLITGQSGSGKTYLINKYVQTLIEKNKYKILLISTYNGDYNNINGFDISVEVLEIVKENKNINEKINLLLRETFIKNNIIILNLNQINYELLAIINEEFLNLLLDHILNNCIYIKDCLYRTKNLSYLNEIKYKTSIKMLLQVGRMRGLTTILCSQRISNIHSDILAECNSFLLGKTSLDNEIIRYRDILLIKSKLGIIFKELDQQFLIYGKNFNIYDSIFNPNLKLKV